MNNKGYMTIEASFIVPIVLFGIFFTIMGLMLSYERGYIIAEENVALYEIPLTNIRNDSVEGYLSGREYTGGVVIGSASVGTSYSSHKAKCSGVLKIYGTNSVSSSREVDVCTGRLRRWQLYDDLREE